MGVGCARRVGVTWSGHRVILFGFLPQNVKKMRAVAVVVSVPQAVARGEQGGAARRDELVGFRRSFYDCLTLRADALFELTDAVLCVDGPVVSLAELSLAGCFRRGHGALYDALAAGGVDVGGMRDLLVDHLPGDGPVTFAVDVTAWPRPDAECSPQRLHCHRPCRCDGVRQTVPGWPYQVVALLESGASSWTAPCDAVRLGPDDDATEVTAGQVRDLLGRLRRRGRLADGDVPLGVFDSGYDLTRLRWLLRDDRVQLLGRIRADRVFYTPAPPRRRDGRVGRRPRHGDRFELAHPEWLPAADQELTAQHARYGTVTIRAWHRLHQKLERRANWADHEAELPIVQGSVILVEVERLPGNRAPAPLWLWWTAPEGTVFDLDRLWRAYLRRFDLEHTFRFFKQVLGWTRARVRTPAQADRWTWLIIAAYAQLRLARQHIDDLRHPWEKPLPPHRPPSPLRVRRGFRRIRRTVGIPARAAKPTRPGPGRPQGRTSGPAPRHPVGKKTRKKDMPRRGGKPQTG